MIKLETFNAITTKVKLKNGELIEGQTMTKEAVMRIAQEEGIKDPQVVIESLNNLLKMFEGGLKNLKALHVQTGFGSVYINTDEVLYVQILVE